MQRFRRYSEYLQQKYGLPAYRVGVDCGFSCPNRSGGRTSPGCIYCDAAGAGAIYQDTALSIEDQVERGITFLQKRYQARIFLLYLQAFSNTHDTQDRLRSIYNRALSAACFSELIVATRPDCIDLQKAALLASYRKPDFDVWVELGLQSAHDTTLQRIGRGHNRADFEQAFVLLRNRGIKLSVHLILGLPGESREDMEATVRYVAGLKPEAVKLHNLHVPFDTVLHDQYRSGKISLLSRSEYLEYVIRALELLPPQTIIQRFSTDTPKERLAAPLDFGNKCHFIDDLAAAMQKIDTYQGRKHDSL